MILLCELTPLPGDVRGKLRKMLATVGIQDDGSDLRSRKRQVGQGEGRRKRNGQVQIAGN